MCPIAGCLLFVIKLSFLISTIVAVPNYEQKTTNIGFHRSQQSSRERQKFNEQFVQINLEYTISYTTNRTTINMTFVKENLTLYDSGATNQINFTLVYSSDVPFAITFDMDEEAVADIFDPYWIWLNAASNQTIQSSVSIVSKQLGASYLRFWIREAKMFPDSENGVVPNSVNVMWNPKNSSEVSKYYDILLQPHEELSPDPVMGIRFIVSRYKGVTQLVFRIVVVFFVTVFIFTMGCELDPVVLKTYAKKPVGPAIGFACQFIIMPLVALGVSKAVPIRPEFGFGLLTIGCSPGGGASNAWSLMLGGDINLSILMTFVSSLSALFMMPLLLFLFARFFIDVSHVRVPYDNITIHLLQFTVPALAGLGLRCWKPNIAMKCSKLTRPMFIFFICFFLSFGVYANWSIFALLGAYPILMPTSALLPWLGFGLAALVAFILKQPRPVIVTIALETGIQNVGIAILVLLYSMPQPEGDLGAVMPIAVSIFTPFPLYFFLLAITIRNRCCKKPVPPVKSAEIYAHSSSEDPEKGTNTSSLLAMASGDDKVENNANAQVPNGHVEFMPKKSPSITKL